MSYPDYNTRFATVLGDSWSAAEARKKITALCAARNLGVSPENTFPNEFPNLEIIIF
jgi:hypothetical protein